MFWKRTGKGKQAEEVKEADAAAAAAEEAQADEQEKRAIKLQPRKAPGDATIVFSSEKSDGVFGEEKTGDSIQDLMRALAAVFYNTIHQCWLSVSDVDRTLERTFKIVSTALQEHEEITFSCGEGKLSVNKQPYETQTQSLETFRDYLERMGANHFTFYSGLAEDEFSRFIGLVMLRPEELEAKGGFYDAVNAEEFKCIKAVKVFFQEVTEEETIISKRGLEKKLEEERLQAEHDVLAMLHGETPEDIDRSAINMKKFVSEDPDRMATMIMAAAKEDQPAGTSDSPAQASAVVTCLRRAFKGLMQDPALKTQKGKKSLITTLLKLEKEIHGQMSGTPAEEEKEVVSDAIESMADELRMDSIASEYTKRLKSIEQSEKRILRFIKAQGLETLEDSDLALKLSEAGLDVSGWQALLAKSEALTAGQRRLAETEDGRLTAVGNLAALLNSLELDVGEGEGEGGSPADADGEAEGECAGKLAMHMAQVEREVESLTEQTETKIRNLVSNADKQDADETSGSSVAPGERLSRRKILSEVSIVVEELCQPLSVVLCSLNMVTSDALGEVPSTQKDMLNLAKQSAQRIERMMDILTSLSGGVKGTDLHAVMNTEVYDADIV